MNMFETVANARLQRRTLFKGVGALGMGLALDKAGFLPSVGSPSSEVAAADSLQDILNATVTVEMFGITFLGAGLDSNSKGGFNPPIPAPVVAILNAARGQEQAHLEFFQGLGGKPLTQTFNVPDPALLTNPVAFFDALQMEETREVAAQIAAMTVFTAMNRPDLVKVSFQYAAEEAEHRLLANYAKGVRPANNYAFAPALYANATDIIADLRRLGIIGGSGPAATFPGPGAIDFSNVTERTPGGVAVSCAAAPAPAPAPAATAVPVSSPSTSSQPSAPPRTGGGGEASFVRRLGDG